MAPKVIQALIRRSEGGFLAECVEFPIGREADSLDGALIQLEQAIQQYFEMRGVTLQPPPALALSLYFGGFTGPEG